LEKSTETSDSVLGQYSKKQRYFWFSDETRVPDLEQGRTRVIVNPDGYTIKHGKNQNQFTSKDEAVKFLKDKKVEKNKIDFVYFGENCYGHDFDEFSSSSKQRADGDDPAVEFHIQSENLMTPGASMNVVQFIGRYRRSGEESLGKIQYYGQQEREEIIEHLNKDLNIDPYAKDMLNMMVISQRAKVKMDIVDSLLSVDKNNNTDKDAVDFISTLQDLALERIDKNKFINKMQSIFPCGGYKKYSKQFTDVATVLEQTELDDRYPDNLKNKITDLINALKPQTNLTVDQQKKLLEAKQQAFHELCKKKENSHSKKFIKFDSFESIKQDVSKYYKENSDQYKAKSNLELPQILNDTEKDNINYLAKIKDDIQQTITNEEVKKQFSQWFDNNIKSELLEVGQGSGPREEKYKQLLAIIQEMVVDLSALEQKIETGDSQNDYGIDQLNHLKQCYSLETNRLQNRADAEAAEKKYEEILTQFTGIKAKCLELPEKVKEAVQYTESNIETLKTEVNTTKENCNKLKQNLDTVKNNVPLDKGKYKNPEEILKEFQKLVEKLEADEKTLENLIQVAKAKNKYKEITESAKTLKQQIENAIKAEKKLGPPSIKYIQTRQERLEETKKTKNTSFVEIEKRLQKAIEDYSAVLNEGGGEEAKKEAETAVKELRNTNTQLSSAQVPAAAAAAEAKDAPKSAATKAKAKPKPKAK